MGTSALRERALQAGPWNSKNGHRHERRANFRFGVVGGCSGPAGLHSLADGLSQRS